MTLWRNDTHRAVWIEHNCHRCFQPDEAARRLHGKDTQCPILAKALTSGRKPPEWERMPRADDMAKTIKCHAFLAQPPVDRRPHAESKDVPMLDLEPHEVHLAPVDGWPERPPKKGVDHA